FNTAISPNVAEVGGQNITPARLARELDLTLRQERQQGNNVSRQDAIDAGLHLRLLENAIGRLALLSYAEKIGVSASDALVAEQIREIPQINNPVTGAFDESAYAQFLSQFDYTQTEFEEEIRGNITLQMLLSSLTSGVRPPSSFGALQYAFAAETRVISVAEAPASAVGTIAAPTAAELQTFYEQNAEQLRIPEFRTLTLVYARPQDFLARVDVPEQRLTEELEARRAAMTRPEQRTYVRLAAQTQEQANAAAARLQRGETADAVAAALSLPLTRGENQSRGEVPDANVADAVFSTPAGAAPRVVQARLTPWAVVQVEGVTPAAEPDLAVVRNELRQAIAADEAADLLNAAMGVFEDTRASGSSVADAAGRAGLTVVQIPAVEAGGRTRDGEPIEALVGHEEALAAAFDTPEGEATDFIPVSDADVLISVDRVIPETVRPLEEVREQLAEAWVARERSRRLSELGRTFADAVTGGQSFAAAARANGFRVVGSGLPFDRQQASQRIPAGAIANQIFGAREGEAVSALRNDGDAVIVALVETINRPDPATAQTEVEARRAQFQGQLGQSVAQAVQGEILANTRVTRNERVLSAQFRASTETTDGQ
ncbi:MAG: SurA N-terminal domain-containing protein, partial [Hyphomonadaceae bacterium]|nr:SurA N-terminal domain-containing protein [Hyphomonadaceae bacterium]